MVTRMAAVLCHSGHLDHHSHPGPWSVVTGVALTLGRSGHHSHLDCLPNPQVTSPTPVPSHLGHPSPKVTLVPITTHSDGDGIPVGRHVEDQLGCAITLGGDKTLEAISLDGDTCSRGLIWVSDIDLHGM